jgi:hypothetical protein
MARLDDAGRAALGYWYNLVSDAARSGFTVTDTIQLANQVAADLGGSVSFKENTAIAQLYGYVRREVNAGEAFTAATSSQSINSDMVSIPPYARDEQEQNSYPLYHVKFEYTYLDQAGNEQTGIRTSVFNDLLPDTVGELTSAVLDDAEAMASKYGHTLLSARPVNILEV